MKMQSVLKVQKSGGYEYLCIYYKQRKNRILVNTGFKPDKGRMTEENLFKNNDYTNSQIISLKNTVDKYINQCRSYKWDISQQGCNRYLNEHNNLNIRIKEHEKPPEKTVMQYFNDFVKLKALELNHYNSLRVYNSLLTNLQGFEKTYRMTFERINNLEFFYKFRNYSVQESHHIDNTISKNVTIIKAFMRYIQDKEIFTFKSALFNFKIKKSPAQVVTLNTDEIREIYYCDKYNMFERNLIDVFIFMCMTSIRYSDYEQLANAVVENNILHKVNEKTKTEINVPLNLTALDILKKYDNTLPKYTNAYFNRELKQIFKRHRLLETPYKKTSIQNKKPVIKSGFKREFITVHKSRSSFITILISYNTPLNEIMAVTGHKKVSTLNDYTDKRLNPDVTKCIAIEKD